MDEIYVKGRRMAQLLMRIISQQALIRFQRGEAGKKRLKKAPAQGVPARFRN